MGTTHVVTVRILNQSERVVGDLVHELHALMIRRVVNATLQDAASVSVGGNFHAISGNSIVDELQTDQQCSEKCAMVPYLIVIRS